MKDKRYYSEQSFERNDVQVQKNCERCIHKTMCSSYLCLAENEVCNDFYDEELDEDGFSQSDLEFYGREYQFRETSIDKYGKPEYIKALSEIEY